MPPPSPPPLRTCVRWIAQLGGFLGRQHDGEPGVKAIWQGLRRLHDIAQTWQLVSSTTSTGVKSSFVNKDNKDATNASLKKGNLGGSPGEKNLCVHSQ